MNKNSCLAAACAILLVSCDTPAPQSHFAYSSSEGVISLHGQWRFSAGDDMRWASPDFDDGKWENVTLPEGWIMRGLPAAGIGWYRTTVVIPENDSLVEPSLWVKEIVSAGEVWWDGVLVGAYGSVVPGGREIPGDGRDIPFHLGAMLRPGTHLLAMRIQNTDAPTGGIIKEAPEIGSFKPMLIRTTQLKVAFGFLAGVFILAGIHLMMLFVGDRARREYLYFSILSFISATVVFQTGIPDQIGVTEHSDVFGRIAAILIMVLPLCMYLFQKEYFRFEAKRLTVLIVGITIVMLPPLFLPLSVLMNVPVLNDIRDIWVQACFLINLYVVGWAVWKRRPGSRTLVAGVLAVAVGTIMAFGARSSLPGFSGAAVFVVMMTISLSRQMSRIQREIRNTRDIFRLFVPEPVLERIARRGLESIHLGGAEEGVATILFIDIKSFTTVAEKLSPNGTLEFLNAFMRRMQPLINDRGGFINQFVGDEIMAIFHHGDHATAALDTALALRNELGRYNQERAMKNERPVEMGIGINTGGIIWGTIGTEARMESAVIGDPVNLASRLQNLTRMYGALILGSEHLVKQVPDMSRYQYREVDIVKVKGKTEAIAVYEFFDGDPEPLRSQKQQSVPSFMEGIVRYRACEWEDAESLFVECLRICPDDTMSKLYIERCRTMRASPPDTMWSGVTVH